MTQLTPGVNYVQNVLGGQVGNYFAPLGTAAETIGINPAGRVNMMFTPSQPLTALQSFAADILDTWTVPSQPYQTKGGGVQYFVPHKSSMKEVRKP